VYCQKFDEGALRLHFSLADLVFLKLMYLRVENAYACNVVLSNHILPWTLLWTHARIAQAENAQRRQVQTGWIRDINLAVAAGARPRSDLHHHFFLLHTWNDSEL
jgi:hypothetical protein